MKELLEPFHFHFRLSVVPNQAVLVPFTTEAPLIFTLPPAMLSCAIGMQLGAGHVLPVFSASNTPAEFLVTLNVRLFCGHSSYCGPEARNAFQVSPVGMEAVIVVPTGTAVVCAAVV